MAEHLVIREIEHYLPLYQLSRRWKDGRRVTLQAPLFPSYIFVHAAHQERGKILGVPGILSIVGTSRGASPLPAAEIESLRDGLHLHNAKPHPFLTVGERARIRSGSLAGMQGIVLRHKNSTRIVLTLELICKASPSRSMLPISSLSGQPFLRTLAEPILHSGTLMPIRERLSLRLGDRLSSQLPACFPRRIQRHQHARHCAGCEHQRSHHLPPLP